MHSNSGGGAGVWDIGNDVDGKPAFVRYCRQPGTRINDIMTLIEQGYSNRAIAAMFGTSASTIKVYRKALHGKLCLIEKKPAPKDEQYEEIKRNIYELHDAGLKPVRIAEGLNVSIDTVRHALKRRIKE